MYVLSLPGEHLKSFEILKDQFLLQKKYFWRYLQLRSCLFIIGEIKSKPPQQSDIEDHIKRFSDLPHTASLIYKYLIGKYSLNSGGLKRVWERLI